MHRHSGGESLDDFEGSEKEVASSACEVAPEVASEVA